MDKPILLFEKEYETWIKKKPFRSGALLSEINSVSSSSQVKNPKDTASLDRAKENENEILRATKELNSCPAGTMDKHAPLFETDNENWIKKEPFRSGVNSVSSSSQIENPKDTASLDLDRAKENENEIFRATKELNPSPACTMDEHAPLFETDNETWIKKEPCSPIESPRDLESTLIHSEDIKIENNVACESSFHTNDHNLSEDVIKYNTSNKNSLEGRVNNEEDSEKLQVADTRMSSFPLEASKKKKAKEKKVDRDLNDCCRCQLCDLTLPTIQLYIAHCADHHADQKIDSKNISEERLCMCNESIVKTATRKSSRRLVSKSRKSGKCFSKKGQPSDSDNHIVRLCPEEKTLECDYCSKSFNLRSTLTNHIVRSHQVDKPFKCNECNIFFRLKGGLTKHMKTHNREKRFKCHECNKSFSRRPFLNIHMIVHLGERQFKCDQCDKSYHQSSDLSFHLRTHTGEKHFECYHCGEGFMKGCSLSHHLRIHSVSEEKPFKCNLCDMAFSGRMSLQNHIRTHTGEKPFKCNICDKRFTRSGSLKEHMSLHSGELAFTCKLCGLSFNHRRKYSNHLKIHSIDRPFQCNQCNISFCVISDLRKHFMKHSNERPYKCDHCDKTYKDKHHLKSHRRKHTMTVTGEKIPEEKRFNCDQCFRGFSRLQNLKDHMRIHTGEKPYKCKQCPKSYSNKSNYLKHSRTHIIHIL